jgi:HEAT repeat protein
MSAIIRVLGEITDEGVGAAAVKVILPKADDVHPDVRREVLLTLCRLQPHAHFDKFAVKIGDPDTKVKKAALHGLGGSGDPRALEKLRAVVANAEQAGQEAAWDLAGVAIENIGALYQSCPKARADIANALPEIADRVVPKKSIKSLFKASIPVPVEVALALATAAGRIEGPQAQAVLERLVGHWSKTVSEAAAEALKGRGAGRK